MLPSESLTARQRQILDGLAAGRSNSVIASELGITMDGVKWHVSELLGESGLSSRRDLAEWWRRETRPRVAPAFLPLRILSHPAAVAAIRIAIVFAVAAAIAAGIVIAATRGTQKAAVIVPATAEKLAYVKDGDIWVKVLPDGAPEQITHHTGDQDAYSSPRWSPSGQWLGFDAGKQPGVMLFDGSGARVLEDAAVWAPSGHGFATVEGADAIIAENADGSGRRIVVPAPFLPAGVTMSVGGLAWSPDGRWIAYTMLEQNAGTPPDRSASIWFVSADGGTPAKVYDAGSPSEGDVRLLGWAPGGRALLFTIDPSFSASAPADGLPLRLLTGLPGDAPRTIDIAPSAPTMLLADGLRQAQPGGNFVAITDGAGRETWTHKRIAVVSWAAGTVVDLTDAGTAAMEPAWSPDVPRIAYVAAPDASGVAGGDEAKTAMVRRKIWVMSADGANQRQLTNDPAYRDEAPRWSSDGSRIYFMRFDTQDRWSLWVMGADGSGARRVLDGLSPDVSTSAEQVWFGYYGLIEWSGVLDYWPGTAR